MSDGSNQPPAKRNLGWLYYFAFLFIASVGVTVGMIVFNLMIQLTPEQLDAARTVWQEKGPRDYKMICVKRIKDDPAQTFAVTVKDRKVTDLRMDGQAITADDGYRMEGLYAAAQRLMEQDHKPGAKRVYTIARFDDKTGALLHFVHNGPERIQIDVKPDWLE